MTSPVVKLYILILKSMVWEIKSFFLSICLEIVLDSQELEIVEFQPPYVTSYDKKL